MNAFVLVPAEETRQWLPSPAGTKTGRYVANRAGINANACYSHGVLLQSGYALDDGNPAFLDGSLSS